MAKSSRRWRKRQGAWRHWGLAAAALTLGATHSPFAWADGGYFSGVQGARATGRGGAFVAKADDLSAVAINPAGLAHIGRPILQLGNQFSYNAHEFTRASTLDWGDASNGVAPRVRFATAGNQRPWQAIDPLLGAASNFGLNDWMFALVAFAPAGVAWQSFAVDSGARYMMVESEAMTLNFSASAAWKYRDQFGLGASLQWLYVPQIRYSLVIDGTSFSGAANPVSSQLDMLSTVTGSDPFTLQAVLGAWYRPVPFIELAASGQVIPTRFRTRSTMEIAPLVPEVNDTVVLRRDGEDANDVTLSLPLPMTARAGIRYINLDKGRERFDVEVDVVYETWSRVDRITLDSNNLTAFLLKQNVPIGVINLEKQWRDTVGVHLGGDYAVVPTRFTVRGGAFYESAVAERAYANVDFMSGAQLGGAIGASLFLEGHEIALAYQYRQQQGIRVSEKESRVYQQVPGSACKAPYTDDVACHPEYLGLPAPPVNAGTYNAFRHIVAVDWIYRF